MPSLTPMVLKRSPTRPAACTPSLICAASRSRCMLQVLPSYHMLQMPTCGFCRSASVRPTPYSIAWDAPWLRGCVTASCTCCSYGSGRRQRHRVEERHHRAQPLPDDFHRVLGFFRAVRLELRQPCLVLGHPVVGELTGLDVLENL